MTVLFGILAAYLSIGLLFWLFVMAKGGLRTHDGAEAPLLPCLIATVLLWPAAIASLEIL